MNPQLAHGDPANKGSEVEWITTFALKFRHTRRKSQDFS